MAAITEMTKAQKEELLCTYAAMILHDEQMDITSDNLTKLIKAAGASVEPFLPALFARALAATNIKDLLTSAGTVGGGAAGAGSGAPAAATEAAPAKAAEEEPEEEEEGDMGFSLFD